MADAVSIACSSPPQPLSAVRLRQLLSYDQTTGAFTWLVSTSNRALVGAKAGTLDKSTGYVRIRIDDVLHHAHRLAWLYVHGEFPAGEIDHRNRSRADNRIDNLRDVPHVANMQNCSLPKNNKSGATGVYWCSGNQRWVAAIESHGTKHILGYFRRYDDAVAARIEGKAKWHQN